MGLYYDDVGHTALIVSLGLLDFIMYLLNNVVFDAYSMLCLPLFDEPGSEMRKLHALVWLPHRRLEPPQSWTSESGFSLRTVSVHISHDTRTVAALNCHLKCMNQLRAPWDETTCSHAARNRHLDELSIYMKAAAPGT